MVDKFNKQLEEALEPYPNLLAVLSGTVSGHHHEWPGMRAELIVLTAKYMAYKEELIRQISGILGNNEEKRARLKSIILQWERFRRINDEDVDFLIETLKG